MTSLLAMQPSTYLKKEDVPTPLPLQIAQGITLHGALGGGTVISAGAAPPWPAPTDASSPSRGSR